MSSVVEFGFTSFVNMAIAIFISCKQLYVEYQSELYNKKTTEVVRMTNK